jgi:hypothetical protein
MLAVDHDGDSPRVDMCCHHHGVPSNLFDSASGCQARAHGLEQPLSERLADTG